MSLLSHHARKYKFMSLIRWEWTRYGPIGHESHAEPDSFDQRDELRKIGKLLEANPDLEIYKEDEKMRVLDAQDSDDVPDLLSGEDIEAMSRQLDENIKALDQADEDDEVINQPDEKSPEQKLLTCSHCSEIVALVSPCCGRCSECDHHVRCLKCAKPICPLARLNNRPGYQGEILNCLRHYLCQRCSLESEERTRCCSTLTCPLPPLSHGFVWNPWQWVHDSRSNPWQWICPVSGRCLTCERTGKE
jgi:hypothetical protein